MYKKNAVIKSQIIVIKLQKAYLLVIFYINIFIASL